MRFPIKLSLDRVPSPLRRFVPCIHNPARLADGTFRPEEFSSYVSSLRVGATWKSTAPRRQPISDGLIRELADGIDRPILIDIAASDGSTSLDLVRWLGPNLGRYYVTDKTWEVEFRQARGVSYFYERGSGECFLRASGGWLVYADTQGAGPLASRLARRLTGGAPDYDPRRVDRIRLCRPELREWAESDERIILCEYDVFEPWPREPAQIIKVANLLNPNTFPKPRIAAALFNLRNALCEGGYLVVVANRPQPGARHAPDGPAVEKVSVYRRVGDGLELLEQANGGADVTGARALPSSAPDAPT